MEIVTIDGKDFKGLTLQLNPKAPLLILQGGRGYLACGYISVATAEKLGDAAAIVRGVKTYDDMLAASVKETSPEAERLGVKPGMTGREALARLA